MAKNEKDKQTNNRYAAHFIAAVESFISSSIG